MNALETLEKLLNTNLYFADLRYCFVTETKLPIKIDGTFAKPNVERDFVKFDDLLLCDEIKNYAGVGISIQASKICAIDVDHCFSIKNDLSSGDSRAIDILNRFKDFAYCEFSFSGTGLRILFRQSVIKNYSKNYYIKNEKNGIEFYQPSSSFRYVTLTGNKISDNFNDKNDLSIITQNFLDDYMKRQVRRKKEIIVKHEEIRSFEELLQLVKFEYFKNARFQNVWFSTAPGSGKDESERDFYLISYLYENITQDKNLIKKIFEESPYFKSKDSKHIYKWNYNDFRYYEYIYNNIRGIK